MYDFIKNMYDGKIIQSDKTVLDGKELDIYLPELKLAFEYNGIYWHSDIFKHKDYHINKTQMCLEKGIQLIHVLENDWIHKKDIIKSIILSKLNIFKNTISIDDCTINELYDDILVRDFLEENDIDGFINSDIKIGLFYQHKLVSLILLNNNTLRCCNILNTKIENGIKTLFNYFINKYHYTEIIGHVDSSYDDGYLYKSLVFEYINDILPEYSYYNKQLFKVSSEKYCFKVNCCNKLVYKYKGSF